AGAELAAFKRQCDGSACKRMVPVDQTGEPEMLDVAILPLVRRFLGLVAFVQFFAEVAVSGSLRYVRQWIEGLLHNHEAVGVAAISNLGEAREEEQRYEQERLVAILPDNAVPGTDDD